MVSITQAEFAAEMDRRLGDLGGKIGVMVDSLDRDLVLTYNERDLYPTASTLKVPMLYALHRQAEADEVDLTQRLTLTRRNRVPGSGILQDLDPGLQPTIRDLAELMIIVSDNWATDLLFEIIGKDRLASVMQEIGLHDTHIPLTIREMFCTIVGMEPSESRYQTLKEALERSDAPDDNLAYAPDPRNDVSTPADMCRLLRLIWEGKGISADSRDAMMTTLRNQNFNTVIPGRLPDDQEIEVAHKTGSLRGIRCDVGIVTSPGTNYVIAMMARGQTDTAETVDRLARASRWIWNEISGRPASPRSSDDRMPIE